MSRLLRKKRDKICCFVVFDIKGSRIGYCTNCNPNHHTVVLMTAYVNFAHFGLLM